MKITTFTVFLFAVSMLGAWRTLNKFQKELIGIRATMMWTGMWLIIGIGAIFPSIMGYFSKLAMMQNRMFFIMLVALLALFAMVFSLHSEKDALNRKLARLVQQVAMLEYKIKKGDNAEDSSSETNDSSETP